MIDQCNSFLVRLYYTVLPQCPKVEQRARRKGLVLQFHQKCWKVSHLTWPSLASLLLKSLPACGAQIERDMLSRVWSKKIYLYPIILQSYLSLGLSSKSLLKGLFLLQPSLRASIIPVKNGRPRDVVAPTGCAPIQYQTASIRISWHQSA